MTDSSRFLILRNPEEGEGKPKPFSIVDSLFSIEDAWMEVYLPLAWHPTGSSSVNANGRFSVVNIEN